jgi:hypothetical protein
MLAAPMARLHQEKQAAVTTGSAGTAGIPCAMVLRLIRILPGDRLSCPRHAAQRVKRIVTKLDTSTGVSGPYDFAVLSVSFVRPQSACCNTGRPSHSTPNVRDDREAPLSDRVRDG